MRQSLGPGRTARVLPDPGSHLFLPKTLPQKDKVFIRYKNKEPTLKTIGELWWDSVYHFGYNKKKGILNNKKGFLELKKHSKKHPFLKKWIRFYEKNIPISDKLWAILDYKDQIKALKKHFKITAVKYAKDYKYCEINPTYILKRK